MSDRREPARVFRFWGITTIRVKHMKKSPRAHSAEHETCVHHAPVQKRPVAREQTILGTFKQVPVPNGNPPSPADQVFHLKQQVGFEHQTRPLHRRNAEVLAS